MIGGRTRWSKHQRYLFIFFKLAILVGLVLFVGFLLVQVRAVAIPALFGAILAYLLNPLVGFLERLKIPRLLSTVVMVLLIFLLMGLVLFVVLPRFVAELASFLTSLPNIVQRLFNHVKPWFEETFGLGIEFSVAEVKGQLTENVSSLLAPTSSLVGMIFTSIFDVLLFFLQVLMVPVLMIFILKDYKSFKEGMASLVPPSKRADVKRIAAKIDRAISSFVRGQLSICAGVAVVYSVGLTIIGVKFSIVLGILWGFLYFIPYLGSLTGLALSFTMAALNGGWTDGVWVLILFGVVHATEETLVYPNVIGDKVGMSPLAVFLSILVGGQLFGILGIFLAVPAAAIIKILATEYLARYKESAFYKE